MKRRFERPIYVNLSCIQDKINEKEVESIDICEDFQGRDLVTFKCPECGEIHKSYRFG